MWRVSNKSEISKLSELCERITCREIPINSSYIRETIVSMSWQCGNPIHRKFYAISRPRGKTNGRHQRKWPRLGHRHRCRHWRQWRQWQWRHAFAYVKKAYYSRIHEHWPWSSLLLNEQFRKVRKLQYR